MSPSDSSTIRVLFVEDAFDQALLVRSFLQSDGGYEVVHVQDGDQALARIRDESWDLLIADLNLPGTDGFDVIRAFRERHPQGAILATTGYTETTYQEEALRAGANDVLHKPLDRDDFLKQVELLVGQTREPAGHSAPAPGIGNDDGAVLAVGGLMGDVEMGCGGSLIQAVEEGRTVLILPLVTPSENAQGAVRGARSAASILGAEVLLEEAALADSAGRTGLLQLALRQVEPSLVYLPAMDDSHSARQEAFRLAKAATAEVPRVLAYQTATTGLDFRPTVFQDVREVMVLKMEALAAYQSAGAGRLDLAPRMAQAYARYWGRFQGFSEVEAFDVLRDDPPT